MGVLLPLLTFTIIWRQLFVIDLGALYVYDVQEVYTFN